MRALEVTSGPCVPFPFRDKPSQFLRFPSLAKAHTSYNDGMRPAWLHLVFAWMFSALAVAECLPFTQARDHVGETRCVTGRVLGFTHGSRGVTFFDFCEDFRVCPFTVVVFPGHLKDIGDVRELTGKVVEIHGPVKTYDGRAEIVLDQLRQLGGDAAKIPRLPKNYDVEKAGHYSAGSMSHPRPARPTTKKKQTPTVPAELPEDDQ
jgi:hypothetical protein